LDSGLYIVVVHGPRAQKVADLPSAVMVPFGLGGMILDFGWSKWLEVWQ
jgi:hypothetical protein